MEIVQLFRLGLTATNIGVNMSDCGCGPTATDTAEQRRTLRIALGLNATMFVVEVVAGFIAGSVGLIADGLDMLADASAHAIGLVAIGRSAKFKANAATASGTLLLLLGLGVLIDVVRRAISGEPPEGLIMVVVAAVALAVNATVLRFCRSIGTKGFTFARPGYSQGRTWLRTLA